MSVFTATVEALVAEVKVLMVGSRQITLSVARQLDRLEFPDMDGTEDFEPMGRVRTGVKVTKTRDIKRPKTPKQNQYAIDYLTWFEEYQGEPYYEFIGRRKSDGALVLFMMTQYPKNPGEDEKAEVEILHDWAATLPLVVLAGLK